jgi:probable F420-dependent oxidoreductase
MDIDVGRVGIWSSARLWDGGGEGGPGEVREAAAELDELGFGALWFGSLAADLDLVSTVLSASRRMVVATGVVNVWLSSPPAVAAFAHDMSIAHPGRFLLGVGASHAPTAASVGRSYDHPLAELDRYLDGLDAAPDPVPAERRVVAALGPRALELAARRSAGAHPYLVTPEHTASAREAIGPDKLLATEQMVVLESDPGVARAVARSHLQRYLVLDNYRRSLLRLGFTDADLDDGGSDRLVDAVFAWGGPDEAAARVADHHAAGADHVCVQAFTADQQRPDGFPALPRAAWRTLADVLLS